MVVGVKSFKLKKNSVPRGTLFFLLFFDVIYKKNIMAKKTSHSLKQELKKTGQKLPHGYALVARKIRKTTKPKKK